MASQEKDGSLEATMKPGDVVTLSNPNNKWFIERWGTHFVVVSNDGKLPTYNPLYQDQWHQEILEAAPKEPPWRFSTSMSVDEFLTAVYKEKHERDHKDTEHS